MLDLQLQKSERETPQRGETNDVDVVILRVYSLV